MNKPRVFVTRRWPEAVERKLSELFDPIFNEKDQPLGEQALSAALEQCDALLPTVTDKVGPAVFNGSAPRARIIANYGVGFSHIDVESARQRGIVVTNTPDVLSECTADIAMTLMLMVARRAGEGERELRAGSWSGWRPTHLVGQKLSGKSLGIIGFGRIGQETARRAHFGFGMEILVYNRSKISDDVLRQFNARQVNTIEELLAEADVVSLHCPGGESNRNLINRVRLMKMKKAAFLINTARGEVVDEDALAEALQNGTIAGAGLDVFDGEPAVRQSLLGCDNAVLLPHLGSATRETREAMGFRVVENLVAFFNGREPADRVV